MVIAFDVKQVREYSLISDKGENRTIFQLGVIDARLSSFISDKGRTFSVGTGGPEASAMVTVDMDQQNYNTVRYGLRGWSNFQNASGFDQKFATTEENVPGVGRRMAVTPECMDLIKPFITELALEIRKDNTFAEQDSKNSAQPSLS
jgi:hypothetical protein